MSAQNPMPCGCRGELDLTYDDAQLIVRLARIRECPLHAAAPQLLAACKLALPELVNEEAANAVRAAIADVEGRA